MYHKIKKLTPFLVFLMTGLFLMACEKQVNSSFERETTVQFRLGTGPAPATAQQWLTGIVPQNPVAADIPGTMKSAFAKTSLVDEAKILVLDMSQWPDENTFIDAWDSTGQDLMWDSTAIDYTKDFWDNEAAYLKSYTGDYYRYAGEYNLNVSDSAARGVVNVNPGLNFFLVCLRENGHTQYFASTFSMIMEGEPNEVFLYPQAGLYAYIMSPQDSMQYQTGEIVMFQGYGEDFFTNIPIPEENYVWTSDKDGQIGTGSFFERSDLSVNTHIITMTVTSLSGLKTTQQVTIIINP